MKDTYILLEDVQGLGEAGATVSVSAGYARNYLLPQNKALKASKGALRQFDARKEKIEAARKAELARLEGIAAEIAALALSVEVQAGADGKLFGSITTHTVAEAITEKGIEIDHTKVMLKEAIRELGEYEIDIKLHTAVIAKAKLAVVKA